MLRQGPLSAFVHGTIEYAVAVLLVAAPFLFGFDHGSAVAASIVMGVALLSLTAMSMLPTGLVRVVTVGVHVAADVAVVALLLAAPFVLGFSSEGGPTALFIVLGLAHLLVTIATRFPRTAARAA